MALVSWLVVVGLLFAVLLFVFYLLSSAVCCLLFVVSCLLSAVCCLLLAVRCLLSAVCCLLSAVCCLLFVVCCLLSTFVICSLFVRCLFTLCTLSFRSLFVLCSLYVCCRHLFASCMPAAVGRKIKYRFHAWQAQEVFSKRQPLIFSHNLCHCGSFFSSRLCGIYVMCVLHQYSCLRPSGRCRRKCLSPPPSRIRYRPTCPRCLSRQPCPGTPSGRCRAKRPFSTTFSNSLWADLPQVSLSPALPGNPIRKVPGESAVCPSPF